MGAYICSLPVRIFFRCHFVFLFVESSYIFSLPVRIFVRSLKVRIFFVESSYIFSLLVRIFVRFVFWSLENVALLPCLH